jgi:hypothetical protein
MEKSSGGIPSQFVHDLVNKLAVIIGHCDLLRPHLKAGSQCTKRVDMINAIARDMADGLNEHQCQVAEAARRARDLKKHVA